MAYFGGRSERGLATCDERIVKVLREAIKHYDFSVICGHRDKETQNKAFREGASKLEFPRSKHNSLPSQAADVVPYPVDWNNLDRFNELNKVIKEACVTVGEEELFNGYDLWDWDYPHWQIGK